MSLGILVVMQLPDAVTVSPIPSKSGLPPGLGLGLFVVGLACALWAVSSAATPALLVALAMAAVGGWLVLVVWFLVSPTRKQASTLIYWSVGFLLGLLLLVPMYAEVNSGLPGGRGALMAYLAIGLVALWIFVYMVAYTKRLVVLPAHYQARFIALGILTLVMAVLVGGLKLAQIEQDIRSGATPGAAESVESSSTGEVWGALPSEGEVPAGFVNPPGTPTPVESRTQVKPSSVNGGIPPQSVREITYRIALLGDYIAMYVSSTTGDWQPHPALVRGKDIADPLEFCQRVYPGTSLTREYQLELVPFSYDPRQPSKFMIDRVATLECVQE